MIEPFPVLPIQLPEHLHSRPIAFTPYSTTSIKQWSSSSSIADRLRTRLYEKGVPPLQIYDFSNRPHHRPIEPFACAKNQMGWINAPAVVEYEHDIYQHLRNIELKSLPEQNYANYHHHKDFDWDTHNSLMDWMIALHSRFRLLPETLYLSINIADRFLSRQLVPMDDISLIIITSLVIGCKYEEGLTPCIPQLIKLTVQSRLSKSITILASYYQRSAIRSNHINHCSISYSDHLC
ncbi:hypothetical protein K492DRAFT_12956 [Lichtheimia hyalospora FSU 10163]|nr:hypothetical protein K492DRAFT_12956 [Lichtheimia hyalospora FSU 10163]